jgi:hypothetical protein
MAAIAENGFSFTVKDMYFNKHRDYVRTREYYVKFIQAVFNLFFGENNRSFAATAMNERSSRSHTIFRITVESRLNDLLR